MNNSFAAFFNIVGQNSTDPISVSQGNNTPVNGDLFESVLSSASQNNSASHAGKAASPHQSTSTNKSDNNALQISLKSQSTILADNNDHGGTDISVLQKDVVASVVEDYSTRIFGSSKLSSEKAENFFNIILQDEQISDANAIAPNSSDPFIIELNGLQAQVDFSDLLTPEDMDTEGMFVELRVPVLDGDNEKTLGSTLVVPTRIVSQNNTESNNPADDSSDGKLIIETARLAELINAYSKVEKGAGAETIVEDNDNEIDNTDSAGRSKVLTDSDSKKASLPNAITTYNSLDNKPETPSEILKNSIDSLVRSSLENKIEGKKENVVQEIQSESNYQADKNQSVINTPPVIAEALNTDDIHGAVKLGNIDLGNLLKDLVNNEDIVLDRVVTGDNSEIKLTVKPSDVRSALETLVKDLIDTADKNESAINPSRGTDTRNEAAEYLKHTTAKSSEVVVDIPEAKLVFEEQPSTEATKGMAGTEPSANDDTKSKLRPIFNFNNDNEVKTSGDKGAVSSLDTQSPKQDIIVDRKDSAPKILAESRDITVRVALERAVSNNDTKHLENAGTIKNDVLLKLLESIQKIAGGADGESRALVEEVSRDLKSVDVKVSLPVDNNSNLKTVQDLKNSLREISQEGAKDSSLIKNMLLISKDTAQETSSGTPNNSENILKTEIPLTNEVENMQKLSKQDLTQKPVEAKNGVSIPANSVDPGYSMQGDEGDSLESMTKMITSDADGKLKESLASGRESKNQVQTKGVEENVKVSTRVSNTVDKVAQNAADVDRLSANRKHIHNAEAVQQTGRQGTPNHATNSSTGQVNVDSSSLPNSEPDIKAQSSNQRASEQSQNENKTLKVADAPVIIRIPVSVVAKTVETNHDQLKILENTGNLEVENNMSTVDDELADTQKEDHAKANNDVKRSLHNIETKNSKAQESRSNLPKQVAVTIAAEIHQPNAIKAKGVLVFNSANEHGDADEGKIVDGAKDTFQPESKEFSYGNNAGFAEGEEKGLMNKEKNHQDLSQQYRKDNFQVNNQKVVSTEHNFESRLLEADGTEFDKNLPILDRKDLVKQVTRLAKFTLEKGKSEMKVQLEPQHLGKMNMKLQVENQKLIAMVRVETAEAKLLIQDNLEFLRESLSEHGVDIQKFDVNVHQNPNSSADQAKWDELVKQNGKNSDKNNEAIDQENTQASDSHSSKSRDFGYNSMELVA